jgi:hypothetical protein
LSSCTCQVVVLRAKREGVCLPADTTAHPHDTHINKDILPTAELQQVLAASICRSHAAGQWLFVVADDL